MRRCTYAEECSTRPPSSSAVEKVVPNLGPAGGSTNFAPIAAKAERAIRPESIAIGVFGLIAALAALVISGLAISRLVRQNAAQGAVVRALGAAPAMVMADALGGVLVTVAVGSLAAVGVALALSPLTPLGPVRPVYPDFGVSADWTVLGFGLVLFTVVLAGTAVLVAFRVAPQRLARRVARVDDHPTWSRATTAAGLPASAVLGIDAALAARSGRAAAPVRSALLGAVVAVTVIVASLTFASSLTALVSQPPLYGWNWNYALLAGFSAEENLPAAQTAGLLDHDPFVAHWAGAYFESTTLDGQSVPVLAMRPNAAVHPSLLSGRALASPSEIVLGPATLASLHAHVGDFVTASLDGHARLRLRIVGTATLPTIGGSGPGGLEMGTGALMATSLFSATDLNQQGSPINGPMADFVTVPPGANQAAALASLNRVTAVLDRKSDPDGPIGGAVSTLRPAEIANYRTVGATPGLLAAILAAGALGALGLTLVASVRQRRRQFAILKSLGFTQRQLAASVAWQSSVAAVVGVIVGVPAGIALGRWTVDAVRPGHLGRASAHGPGPVHRVGRPRGAPLRQPGRPHPRAPRRTDAHLAAAPVGVTSTSARRAGRTPGRTAPLSWCPHRRRRPDRSRRLPRAAPQRCPRRCHRPLPALDRDRPVRSPA